jgi:D-alanyl-D-alanine dipeptidase
MTRPWHAIPIAGSAEALQSLPETLLRFDPHPYVALGAPYPPESDPFRLRQSVVQRLLQAQTWLQHHADGVNVLIFDAWRPLAVQRFMVEYTRALPGVSEDQVLALWATPSEDPSTPPPHSTGAAVDLTLADAQGQPLDLGGEIDAVGAIAEPDHFAGASAGSAEARFHQRRKLLNDAMTSAGFARHPREWWHFSWGDQLWAWQSGQNEASYGRSAQA